MTVCLEPKIDQCAMPEHNPTVLDNFGVTIQHGYESHPWPGIAQVLWFSIASTRGEQSPSLSTSYFWIEHATHQLQVVRLSGLTCNPETMIPFFAKVQVDTDDSATLEQQLGTGWLLSPPFWAKELPNSPLAPTTVFLRNVIREELAAMLGDRSQPEALRTELEALLEMPTVSFNEKFGNNCVQRHLWPLPSEKHLLPLPARSKAVLADAEGFRNRLSADILTLFERYIGWLVEPDSVHNYNKLVGWTGNRRRNRIQAMTAFPWLFHEFGLRTGDGEFFHTPPSNIPPVSTGIIEAIDTGRPILRQLAQHYDVQPYTIRNASRLLKIHYLRPESIPAFFWLLDGMKPDHQPRNPAGFRALLPALHWICNWKLDVDRSFVGKLVVELFHDGIAGSAQLFHRWCPSHDATNPYNDVQDFISAHADNCGYTTKSGDLFGNLFREWVCGADYCSFFVASEQWHMEWWMRDQVRDDLTWTPLLNAPVSIGSLIAHELSNSAMLLEEGIAMRHCIASYAPLCAEGNNFVFSLQTTEGIRRSTLHVTKDAAQHFRVEEHRSFANHSPDQTSSVAAQMLITHLSHIK